jgi:hypothetical protein
MGRDDGVTITRKAHAIVTKHHAAAAGVKLIVRNEVRTDAITLTLQRVCRFGRGDEIHPARRRQRHEKERRA